MFSGSELENKPLATRFFDAFSVQIDHPNVEPCYSSELPAIAEDLSRIERAKSPPYYDQFTSSSETTQMALVRRSFYAVHQNLHQLGHAAFSTANYWISRCRLFLATGNEHAFDVYGQDRAAVQEARVDFHYKVNQWLQANERTRSFSTLNQAMNILLEAETRGVAEVDRAALYGVRSLRLAYLMSRLLRISLDGDLRLPVFESFSQTTLYPEHQTPANSTIPEAELRPGFLRSIEIPLGQQIPEALIEYVQRARNAAMQSSANNLPKVLSAIDHFHPWSCLEEPAENNGFRNGNGRSAQNLISIFDHLPQTARSSVRQCEFMLDQIIHSEMFQRFNASQNRFSPNWATRLQLARSLLMQALNSGVSERIRPAYIRLIRTEGALGQALSLESDQANQFANLNRYETAWAKNVYAQALNLLHTEPELNNNPEAFFDRFFEQEALRLRRACGQSSDVFNLSRPDFQALYQLREHFPQNLRAWFENLIPPKTASSSSTEPSFNINSLRNAFRSLNPQNWQVNAAGSVALESTMAETIPEQPLARPATIVPPRLTLGGFLAGTGINASIIGLSYAAIYGYERSCQALETQPTWYGRLGAAFTPMAGAVALSLQQPVAQYGLSTGLRAGLRPIGPNLAAFWIISLGVNLAERMLGIDPHSTGGTAGGVLVSSGLAVLASHTTITIGGQAITAATATAATATLGELIAAAAIPAIVACVSFVAGVGLGIAADHVSGRVYRGIANRLAGLNDGRHWMGLDGQFSDLLATSWTILYNGATSSVSNRNIRELSNHECVTARVNDAGETQYYTRYWWLPFEVQVDDEGLLPPMHYIRAAQHYYSHIQRTIIGALHL
ncbi:MAG: hypothetical protein ABH859_01225 [Pseudomonadota bacterium]